MYFYPNQPGAGRGSETAHGVFCFKTFLMTYPNFMKVGDFSRNLFGTNILNFLLLLFFSNSNWCQHFFTTSYNFLCTLFVGIINISLAILAVFESRGFRKSFYDFCNNTFPIDAVTINFSESFQQLKNRIAVLSWNNNVNKRVFQKTFFWRNLRLSRSIFQWKESCSNRSLTWIQRKCFISSHLEIRSVSNTFTTI